MLEDTLVPIFAIAFVFGSPVVIIGLVLAAYTRRRAMIHETINKAIESGQPLPDELVQAFETRKTPNFLMIGIILLASALGLGLCLTILVDLKVASLAAIPLFLSFGFLILNKVEKNKAEGADRDSM